MAKRLDNLGIDNLKIIQDDKLFCFGIDSVLLANFIKSNSNKNILVDLGTGSAVMPILLTAKAKFNKIYGIELQDKMFDLANENVKLNNLGNKIEIVKGNIKEIKKYFKANSVDIVFSNPPYKKKGTGVKNESIEKTIARHEIECTLEDIILAAKYLLKEGGRFYLVHKPERLTDIMCLSRENKIEPKRLTMIHSEENDEPCLVIVECIKHAKSELRINKPLIIYTNKNNNIYTDEIYRMYNMEKK